MHLVGSLYNIDLTMQGNSSIKFPSVLKMGSSEKYINLSNLEFGHTYLVRNKYLKNMLFKWGDKQTVAGAICEEL